MHDPSQAGGTSRWGIHVCLLDRECRRVDRIHRAYLFTPWGHLGVAYAAGDRFARTLEQRPTWFDLARS